MRHLRGLNEFVELLSVQETQRHAGLLERRTLFLGLVRDLRRFVVADVRRERSHQHERPVDELGDPFALMAAAKQKKAGAAGGASPLSNILGNLKKK